MLPLSNFAGKITTFYAILQLYCIKFILFYAIQVRQVLLEAKTRSITQILTPPP